MINLNSATQTTNLVQEAARAMCIKLLKYLKQQSLLFMFGVTALPNLATSKALMQNNETTYREIDFKALVCKRSNANFSAENIYLVKKSRLDNSRHDLKTLHTEAIKFSDGKRYRVTYIHNQGRDAELFLAARNSQSIKLDCKTRNQSLKIGSTHPLNKLGHYIDVANVDDKGAYGSDVQIEVCTTGAHCDYGTQGLVLKNHKNEEVWARMIAIKDKLSRGHPTYNLPMLYPIRYGVFDEMHLLDDESLLLTYDNSAAIRISVKNGFLLNSNKNVSSVDLKDWAEVKRIYSKRFLKTNSFCYEGKKCAFSNPEANYFYSLQFFLFPHN